MSSRPSRALGVILVCLATGCWVGERDYPYLRDARSAAEQRDAARAYGAAHAILDNQAALESSASDLEEARRIARDAEQMLAERRLEQAAREPKTRDGLQRRIELLGPILAPGSELTSLRSRAVDVVVDGILPLWANLEPRVRKESYGAAFAAVAELEKLVGPDTPLRPRVDAVKLRMAKEHEARAGMAGTSVLGKAWRRWHLAAATKLGAKHDLRALDRDLGEAFSVGVVVGQLDSGAACSIARADVEKALAQTGSQPVTVSVRVRCDVARSMKSERRTRTVYDEMVTTVPVKREVIVGYRQETYEVGGGEQCLTTYDGKYGRMVKDTSRCWHNPSTRLTREKPIYKTVTEMEQQVVRVPREIPYDVVWKTKTATVKVEVEAEGASTSYDAEEGFEDFATSGDAGNAARRFRTEPSDAELVRAAGLKALEKASSVIVPIVQKKRERILEQLRAESSEVDVEEAFLAAQAFTGNSAAELALRERWGGKRPEGEEAAAVEALTVSVTASEPLARDARYDFEPPKPVEYLNVAHGAGWLVSPGVSLDVGAQAALLDPGRTHAWLGGSLAPFGGRAWGIRASASGASPAIAGDAGGYAVGLAYARSLRGDVDHHHRFELVTSIGVVGGLTKLDEGLGPVLAKERFVRVPLVLSVSVPFYYVAFQGQLAVEPNVLALVAPGDGWYTPHVGSAWLGVLPVPWISVLAGVESAASGPSSAPRPGLRLGVRM